MYSCPACGDVDATGRLLCLCGADLSLLQRLDALGNLWFNQALDALDEGNLGSALEWLSACCVVRPRDAGALRAKAKIWARLGHFEEARNALNQAASSEPDTPELGVIRQAVDDASREQPSGRVKMADDTTHINSNRSKGGSKRRVKRYRQ